MIKALLLVVAPGLTWEDIARARRNVFFVLFLYFLPLLILSSAAEGYGLVHWGKARGQAVMHVRTFPLGESVVYEAGQGLVSLLTVFLCAAAIRSLGDTFHTRSTYRASFALVAYGLGPLYLIKLFDAFAGAPYWMTWVAGIGLSVMALYAGVPRMLEPDLTNAFGLFLTSAIVLVLATGLVRLVTAFYLAGKSPMIGEFISGLGARLRL